MLLKQALQETYASWKNDLSDEWLAALSNIELAFESINQNFELEAWEPIFPARKGKDILGAPHGASTLNAFEQLSPDKVRVVIIGQDPYPNIAQATGRAFEQGDVNNWVQDSHKVTASMRRILQSVGDFRSEKSDYSSQDASGWKKLINDLTAKTLHIENRRDLFDHWTKQGVLMLNTGLTITRFKKGGHPHQLEGHIPLWRPLIDEVMRMLAGRNKQPVLFALWGDKALDIFRNADIEQIAKAADKWRTSVRSVHRDHPAYVKKDSKDVPFFQGENVFGEINSELIAMGETPIAW